MKTLTIEQVQLDAIKRHINQFSDSELAGLCRNMLGCNMLGNAQLKYAAAHELLRRNTDGKLTDTIIDLMTAPQLQQING